MLIGVVIWTKKKFHNRLCFQPWWKCMFPGAVRNKLRHTAEAEYIAYSMTVKEAIWLKNFVKWFEVGKSPWACQCSYTISPPSHWRTQPLETYQVEISFYQRCGWEQVRLRASTSYQRNWRIIVLQRVCLENLLIGMQWKWDWDLSRVRIHAKWVPNQ